MSETELKKTIIKVSPEVANVQRDIKLFLERFFVPRPYSYMYNRLGYKAYKQLERYPFIKMDIEHFYESITYSRVLALFKTFVDNQRALKWTKHSVYNGTLMRGSICSNIIAEYCTYYLDRKLLALARDNHLEMAKYVDEYLFYINPYAGEHNPFINLKNKLELVSQIKNFVANATKEIRLAGFVLNPTKSQNYLTEN